MSADTMVPVRHDMVSFVYHGKNITGEVRRVYNKPKGTLVVVKVGDGEYRSCYMEQMEDFLVTRA